MDLEKLDTTKSSNAGAVLHLCHPITGEPLYVDDANEKPMTLTLLGQDSDEYRTAQQEATSWQVNKLASGGGRRGNRLDASDLEGQRLSIIIAVTKGWCVNIGGKSPELSEGALRTFYKRFPWAREQAESYVGDRANFLGN